MNGGYQKREGTRALGLLAIGALLSSVPLLLSMRTQPPRENSKETKQARQLDVLAAYVQTCNRFNLDRRRVLSTLENVVTYKSGAQMLDQSGAEMKAHSLEYNLQIEIVNLTFGEHIQPFGSSAGSPAPSSVLDLSKPLDLQNPFNVAALRQEFVSHKTSLERDEQECEETAKRLLDRIKSAH